MTNLTASLAALVFLVFAVHRLVTTRGGRVDPAHRDVAGFALCAGTAMLLNAPAVMDSLDRLLPSPDAELLLTYQLNVAAAAFLVLIALTIDPPAAERKALCRRRRIRAAVLVQAAALGLFLGAGVTTVGASAVAAPGRGWVLASYNVLFAGYSCWCLYVLAQAVIRQTRRTPPGSLRTGLRLATLATATAAVWALWALDDAAANLAQGSQGLGEDVVSTTLGMVTAVLATAGATATRWGDRITAPLRRLRARRAHKNLEPLWSALYAELPEIALDPDAAVRRPGLRRAEFALYRRVIEIRDGSMALRAYQQTEALTWAMEALDRAGPAAADPEAVLEAAVIAAALENKRAGRTHSGTPDQHRRTPTAHLETTEDEAAWLVRVTRALIHSRVVGDVLDRMRDHVAAGTESSGRA
ncbi:MAB_1171c family putative transporter [Streptomyces sp. NPDC021225]|uniref:MAB_1171c family putative transporter n=1 Tax=Streptomyces sp. NPDC021225 TaxID=3365121 RepID=UPI0037AAB4B3